MAGSRQTTAGAETKEKILQAAERLFAEKGFYGAGLREIGGEVGISNASLLYHFPSKGRLYVAVIDRIAEKIGEVVVHVENVSGSDVDRFVALYNAYFDWAQERTDYARIIMREMMDNLDRVNDIERWHLADSMYRLSRVIAKGQKHGSFRSCNAELFLYHVIGSISYFVLGLPTIGKVMEWAPGKALPDFREETLQHLLRSLLKKKAFKELG
ncbi:MAG: TetR/AcrR family transcriptional regulator [Alphaproteobacteria bacterium]|nr:TetR/AcrR family transcriptional regulator [Rhodospirillales bacterium]MCW9045764.1 TetR/AcrR family transcriptional regulator [Alphaproteobacteria bacterium]